MPSSGELDNARRRMLNALDAVSKYVYRPSSQPPDSKLFQKLVTELQDADEAYRILLYQSVNQNQSNAAD